MWEALPGVFGEEKAALLMNLSDQARYRSAYVESLELAQAGIRQYEELGAPPSDQLASAYLSLANAHQHLKNNDEAMGAADKAIVIAKADNYPFLDDLLRSKAIWSSETGNWQVALETYSEAARFNELNGADVWMARSLFNVGLCHNEMEQYPESVAALRKARKVFTRHKKVADVGRVDSMLADSLVALKSGDEALAAARRALDVAEIIQERIPTMWAQYVSAKAYILLEDFEAATQALSDANHSAISCKSDEMDWTFIIGIQEALANLLRLQNKFAEADEVTARIQTIKEICEWGV
jgi:tetratricopeptide (TPR) repeat protein